MLVIFDISVLTQTGFDISAFAPDAVFSGSLPIGLLLAATGYLGFEATALFSEEAKRPLTTIPRATYAAIISIALILGISTWALVSATGVAKAQDARSSICRRRPDVLALEKYLGGPMSIIAEILLLVSLFAAMLAFHNSATRYLYSMGRARVLPNILARTRKNGAPAVAGLVQALFGAVIAGLFAIAGLNPIVEPRAGHARLRDARRPHPAGTGGAFDRRVVPSAARPAMVEHLHRAGPRVPRPDRDRVLALFNFDSSRGRTTSSSCCMPLLLVLAVIGGILYGMYLKRSKPAVYAALATDIEKFNIHVSNANEGPHIPEPSL